MAGTSDSHAIIVANLVSQDRLQVEVFQRNEVGRWELYEVADAGIWELASIGFQAELAALCEDVVFEPIAETDSETDSISS
ncbi:MAG: hypothetical protein HC857_17120 [Synechococcales cyanobacterium RU_4_20]|nr:hypothetical protein [Synechococcales cyanobacterium RU_4_20]NJR68263.1 hypothetical protein [Synechococcales cyanobacterium CRU_2_2]